MRGCGYVCVHACACMCVHVHVCMRVTVCLRARACVRVRACVCTCVHMLLCTCVHVCARARVCSCVCACLCACERFGSLLTWEGGSSGPAAWRWWGGDGLCVPGTVEVAAPSSGAVVDPVAGLGRAMVGIEIWGWLRSPLRMGTSASRRKGLGSQCGVEAARRHGGAPGQRMRLRDRLGMLTEMAGPHGKRGPGGPGLLPGNWGLGAPWGAWGRSRGRGTLLVPLPLLASQMDFGTRTVVGSCTEPACRHRGQTCCSSGRGLGLPMDGAEGDACCPGASVSPRRGGRPVSTTPAELPGAPPALGNQAKHESIPIPVCQEGPWGANCSPLSGHGRGCQDLDARPSPPAPGPQQTLQLHSGGLEALALSLHLRCLSSPRGWPVLGLQLEPLSGGLAGPGHLGTLQGQD